MLSNFKHFFGETIAIKQFCKNNVKIRKLALKKRELFYIKMKSDIRFLIHFKF